METDSKEESDKLNVLTIFFIGIAGIIIKFFFSSNTTLDGITGPANSNIWGNCLTALSLFLLIFIVYGHSVVQSELLKFIEVIPILITLFLIMYSIYLNLTFLTNINKINGTDETYDIYNSISNFLLIIQISIIIKYVYDKIFKPLDDVQKLSLTSYFIGVLNLCLLIIINIILYFYSLDI